ncbi:hypothetical protein GF362_01165 [Candidatus Dojkabacteria bacterium]|nr:hypothetical protein [Candidatus Dojkabacteria bacterium]
MTNILDISQALTNEMDLVLHANDLKKNAQNKDFKEMLEKLEMLGIEKALIWLKILKEGPWEEALKESLKELK